MPASIGPSGHEWAGGAVGNATLVGGHERWGRHNHAPHNASQLLLGVLSAAPNFNGRDLLRRALWRQRPWRLGAGWKFIVGDVLPRGDNNRISLGYEAAKYGDVDVVHASELPPLQARKGLKWLQHVMAVVEKHPQPPTFVGVSTEQTLVYLPRLLPRLRALAPFTTVDSGAVYAGDLHWAAWPTGKADAWACISAVEESRSPTQHRAGPLPASRDAAMKAARGSPARRPCGVSPASLFLSASPELHVFSAPLLRRMRMPVAALLDTPTSLAHAPPRHADAASERAAPAAIAAAALARQVSAAAGPVTLAHIYDGASARDFTWEEPPETLPARRDVLVRGVYDALVAETVVTRFDMQRHARTSLECSRDVCKRWGVQPTAATATSVCCSISAMR